LSAFITQGLHGCQHALRGRRGAQFQQLPAPGEQSLRRPQQERLSGRASSSASLTLR
jgi:hypothetical protein